MRRKPLSKFSTPTEGTGYSSIFWKQRKQIMRGLYEEGLMDRHQLAQAFGLTLKSVEILCRGIPDPRKWQRPRREPVLFPTPEVTPGCGYSVMVWRAHATLKEYEWISKVYALAEAQKNASEEPPKAMAAKK